MSSEGRHGREGRLSGSSEDMADAPQALTLPYPPVATYRWQFHGDFTFRTATALVPYLADLGVSHCYSSPYLKAHPGSRHGYDIADHEAINPEVGTDAERLQWLKALRAYGLSQIVDIVPNHMRVDDPGNRWWWDVLQYGKNSPYAHYFDIDWQSLDRQYTDKVVIPILGSQYGEVLESDAIVLGFDQERGEFIVRYYDHMLPVVPVSYALILSPVEERLRRLGSEAEALSAEVGAVAALCRMACPLTAEGVSLLRTAAPEVRVRLTRLWSDGVYRAALSETLVALNGGTGEGPGRFDALHKLLEEQAYRLAYWRVSGAEMNYRRFFDVNELAALRVEDGDVFLATHALIGAWLEAGDLTGLRVDHPDGLRDPEAYFIRLKAWAAHIQERASHQGGASPVGALPPVYLVVEKILARDEQLPSAWPVDGTTGYDFAALVNGILVDPQGEATLDALYEEFVGAPDHFADMLYACKKLVMHTSFAGEVHALGRRLERIAEYDRRTRDFTLSAQMAALFEVVACFPVYRTYVTERGVGDADRGFIVDACAKAKTRDALVEGAAIDFMQGLLLLEGLDERPAEERREILAFVAAFQQYTAPVMAKGLEDTLFYRYNRLISLNEVGGHPAQFSVSREAFHEANSARLRDWPHAMVSTSTHDTKRSEDVRARLDVLSEIPALWGAMARFLRERHAPWKRSSEPAAPAARDEYFFYQSLIGIWPFSLNQELWPELKERMLSYMLKAAREAKNETSWVRPQEEYEAALSAFVERVLDYDRNSTVLAALDGFIKPLMRVGLWNGLSQLALKLMAPGVPDIYQGTELWDFSLVDPDNRRPVDYEIRMRHVRSLKDFDFLDGPARRDFAYALLMHPEDGLVKMHVVRVLLQLRARVSDIFAGGVYVALCAEGALESHLLGFARVCEDRCVLIIVPRHYWALTGGGAHLPLGSAVWETTAVRIPVEVGQRRFDNVLTGESVDVGADGAVLWAADLFRSFPVAVLVGRALRGLP